MQYQIYSYKRVENALSILCNQARLSQIKLLSFKKIKCANVEGKDFIEPLNSTSRLVLEPEGAPRGSTNVFHVQNHLKLKGWKTQALFEMSGFIFSFEGGVYGRELHVILGSLLTLFFFYSFREKQRTRFTHANWVQIFFRSALWSRLKKKPEKIAI